MYEGPILVASCEDGLIGNRAYATFGPAPTIRAQGKYPAGIFKTADGVYHTLCPREAARCLDISDDTDIGERFGVEAAQCFVGNSMSIKTVREIGIGLMEYLGR